MSLGSVILLPIFSALGFTGKTGSPDLGPSHCAVLSIAEDSISLRACTGLWFITQGPLGS